MFQLFRKDLISAMKLPDNEPLEADDYWTVTDTWKQEWEKGVQVRDITSMVVRIVMIHLPPFRFLSSQMVFQSLMSAPSCPPTRVRGSPCPRS